jgi:hypothetical protein
MTSTRPANFREFPARIGITIDLDHLHELMSQYCNEKDGDKDSISRRLYLSGFLEWLRRRGDDRWLKLN